MCDMCSISSEQRAPAELPWPPLPCGFSSGGLFARLKCSCWAVGIQQPFRGGEISTFVEVKFQSGPAAERV